MRSWWSRSARREVFCPSSWCALSDSSSHGVGVGYPLRPHTRLVGAPTALLLALVCRGLRGHPTPPCRGLLRRAHPEHRRCSSACSGVTRLITDLCAHFARTSNVGGGLCGCALPLGVVIGRTGGANHRVQLQDSVGRRVRGPLRRFSKRARGGEPRPSRARERS